MPDTTSAERVGVYPLDGVVRGTPDLAGQAHYLMEGDIEQPYLEVPDRIQLLTHRCFIITPERCYEEFLWDVTYQEVK